MTPWRALARWLGAVGGVIAVLGVLWLALADELQGGGGALGPTERRINVVADAGDEAAPTCDLGLRRGDAVPTSALGPTSTGCVVVGVVDDARRLRWFFVGRANGDGTVVVPKPTRSGIREVLLENGAVVPIGSEVRVRCSPDPNERFEAWIARGLATAGYLDAFGFLVAIDCEPPDESA